MLRWMPLRRLALQGWRPGGATQQRALQGGAEQPAEGDSLLAYWKGLLDDRQRYGGGAGPLSDNEVRQLLHTALRMRQGKAQSSLPEQLVAVFMQYYKQLDSVDKRALFHSLTAGFGTQAAEVDAAAAAWQQLRQRHQQAGAAGAAAAEPLLKAAAQLAGAATPLYSRLFVPMSQQPGGIKFLVDMRAQLMQAVQEQPSGAAQLRALSDALRQSLAEWFSVGLLQLQRISWEGSSASLLEKVAAGEAVHDIVSWGDLKGRLNPDNRRVFAFLHQAMPGQPLVVLHTALTDSVARSMRELLPPEAAAAAAAATSQQQPRRPGPSHHGSASSERTWEQREQQQQERHLPASNAAAPGAHFQHQQQPSVAVFYSISATQRGLAGVDLGNFLIKQVAHRVLAEFPGIKTLCTLSPMPGFSDWLRIQVARAQQGLPPAAPLLLPQEAAGLEDVAAGHLPPLGWQQSQQELDEGQASSSSNRTRSSSGSNHSSQSIDAPLTPEQQAQQRAASLLSWALTDDSWLHSGRLEAAVQAPMLRLAAHYLLRERRRGLALDPVANFHLRNGAAVLQLNWRADLSPAGLRRSHGLMVNYSYDLPRLHDNNRAYLVDGRVTAAPEVQALLAPAGGG